MTTLEQLLAHHTILIQKIIAEAKNEALNDAPKTKITITDCSDALFEELETAGKSIEMGILPTLSAIRAPSVIARAQGIGEKIFKTSDRLKKNGEIMAQKINDFKLQAGSNTADEAGDALLQGLKENNKALKNGAIVVALIIIIGLFFYYQFS